MSEKIRDTVDYTEKSAGLATTGCTMKSIQDLRAYARLMLGVAAVIPSLGCANPPEPEPYIPKNPPEMFEPITVFVEDASFVQSTMDGCRVWSGEGVSCILTNDAAQADVRVAVDNGPCQKLQNGEDTLGRVETDMHGKQTIMYFQGCNSAYGESVKGIVAHEFGHLFGLPHIPLDSSNNTNTSIGLIPIADVQGPIYGLAIMNPTDTNITVETIPDHRAFGIRDMNTPLTPLRRACTVDTIDRTNLPTNGTDKYIPVTITGSANWYKDGYKLGDPLVNGVNHIYISNGSSYSTFHFLPGTLVIEPLVLGSVASVEGLPPEVSCQRAWLKKINRIWNNNTFNNSCEVNNGILPDCILPGQNGYSERIVIRWQ